MSKYRYRYFLSSDIVILRVILQQWLPAELGQHVADRDREVRAIIEFIDRYLSQSSVWPPLIYAESNDLRPEEVKSYQLVGPKLVGWSKRIDEMRRTYRDAMDHLSDFDKDRLTFDDYTTLQRLLPEPLCLVFKNLLFEHMLEAMFSLPEYGGNPEAVWWERFENALGETNSLEPIRVSNSIADADPIADILLKYGLEKLINVRLGEV